MTAYQSFALLYDELMADVPYDKWIRYVEEMFKQYGNGVNRRILDVGCGTGSISVPLARKGYHVTGIDLSEDMLAVAHSKAYQAGVDVSFFQQDMREIVGFKAFDCICIFCDSLNYLTIEDDVKKTFKSVFDHLAPNGLFLFDVHSLYKLSEVFIGHSYCSNDDDIAYIWNCYQGDSPYSVEHELSFFVKQNEFYERFDELHFQRTFPISYYEQLLTEIGFSLLKVTADFREEPPAETSERIFFSARKPNKIES